MDKQIKSVLDSICRGLPIWQRFIIFALAILLGDRVLEAIDLSGNRSGLNPSETVAGKPFALFYGMSPQQIRDFLGNDPDKIAEVQAAFESRGIKVKLAPDSPPAPVVKESESDEKIVGYTLDELEGKTDAELIAMPRIGKETVKKIRELQAKRK